MTKMTKNRKIALAMHNKIREFGYEPYNIEFRNGYFVFDYGEDAVVHFRVKGVSKHWLFGMWIFSDVLDEQQTDDKERPFIQIFAQYDTQVDKFKPSRSELSVTIKKDSWCDDKFVDNKYLYWELEAMLNMIRKHPLLCYSGFCGEYIGFLDFRPIKKFLKYEGQYYFELIKKRIMKAIFLPYTKFKIALAKKDKCLKHIELYDFEKNFPGLKTSYLYEVKIIFKKDATDKQIGRWFDRWFRRKNYGKFSYYDSVIEVDLFRIDGKKEYFSINKK